MPPKLLFTIDVEEDMPQWQVQDPITVRNAQMLPKLAEICRKAGVKPTYLCSYPMVTQRESASILKKLHREGGCEVGMHLHPWNSPPFLGVPGKNFDERATPYYQSDLDEDRLRQKLKTLHDAIGELSGAAPKSFRAGRFGMSNAAMRVLIQLGYEVDTSVTPLVHHYEDGGPDYRRAPMVPYLPSAHDFRKRGDLPIVEIPVSISLTRPLSARVQRAYARIPQKTRIRGLLSRDYLHIVDFAWLYPARFDESLLKRCADALVKAENPVLNVFLHSSELMAGQSSYIDTEADAAECLRRIRVLLEYCIQEFGAKPATLTEAARALRPSLTTSSSAVRHKTVR